MQRCGASGFGVRDWAVLGRGVSGKFVKFEVKIGTLVHSLHFGRVKDLAVSVIYYSM